MAATVVRVVGLGEHFLDQQQAVRGYHSGTNRRRRSPDRGPRRRSWASRACRCNSHDLLIGTAHGRRSHRRDAVTERRTMTTREGKPLKVPVRAAHALSPNSLALSPLPVEVAVDGLDNRLANNNGHQIVDAGLHVDVTEAAEEPMMDITSARASVNSSQWGGMKTSTRINSGNGRDGFLPSVAFALSC